jgi:hypothetical protein
VETLVERVSQVFQKLVGGLPPGTAVITSRALVETIEVEIRPANPHAAPILAIIPKDDHRDLTLVIGKGTFFEVPPEGGRYTGSPLLHEIKTICEAVIARGCHEKVRLKEGEGVVWGKGTVDIPPPVTVRWRQVFSNPFRRARAEEHQYEPY